MDTVAERIAWLLAETGLTQRDFANALGITENTVSTWVNGRNRPQRSNLATMAKVFGFQVSKLVRFIETGGEPPKRTESTPVEHPAHHPRKFVASESAKRIPAGTIPVINRVPAGNGMALTDQDFAPNFSHETVDAGPWASPGSVAFFVQGDSMAPDFLDGDLVIGDPNKPCADHCFAIVQFGPERGEENKLRRVLKTPNGTLLLPSNPKYNKEIVDPETIVSLLRVVEFRRPVV